ncbi:MAG TPA: hypothetical protein GX530_03295 [Corynebacteriales bacterium]|nr:hypothetical protein [Mycobacteriales bacterium]
MIIAWNGATGVVGTTAVNYLLRRLTTASIIGSGALASGVTSIELRLIGRSADRLNALAAQVRADYPQITVTPYPECFSDAHTDPAAWPGNPLAEADIFVNTAGPGYKLAPIFAGYCARTGIPYVDPAGDPTILHQLTDQLAAAGVQVTVPLVLGAGIQPGLSGVLVRALAEKAGDGGVVTIYAGGAQPTTPAAVEEFVESVNSGMRWAGMQWVDGTHVPTQLGEAELAAAAAEFSATATAHPHCDLEIARAAAKVPHRSITVQWNNINDASHTQVEIQKLMVGSSTLEKVLEAAEMDDFGRKHYFRMEGTAVTSSGDIWRTTLNCTDSFLVTASVTAQAAQAILAPPTSDALAAPSALPVGLAMPCDLDVAYDWWHGVMDDPAGTYAPAIHLLDNSDNCDEEGEL